MLIRNRPWKKRSASAWIAEVSRYDLKWIESEITDRCASTGTLSNYAVHTHPFDTESAFSRFRPKRDFTKLKAKFKKNGERETIEEQTARLDREMMRQRVYRRKKRDQQGWRSTERRIKTAREQKRRSEQKRTEQEAASAQPSAVDRADDSSNRQRPSARPPVLPPTAYHYSDEVFSPVFSGQDSSPLVRQRPHLNAAFAEVPLELPIQMNSGFIVNTSPVKALMHAALQLSWCMSTVLPQIEFASDNQDITSTNAIRQSPDAWRRVRVADEDKYRHGESAKNE